MSTFAWMTSRLSLALRHCNLQSMSICLSVNLWQICSTFSASEVANTIRVAVVHNSHLHQECKRELRKLLSENCIPQCHWGRCVRLAQQPPPGSPRIKNLFFLWAVTAFVIGNCQRLPLLLFISSEGQVLIPPLPPASKLTGKALKLQAVKPVL